MHWRTESCLLGLLAGAVAQTLPAQSSPIHRHSIQIGGSARLTHTRDIGNDRSWTILELTPRIGYFIARGLAVSGNLRFERTFESAEHLTGWGIGPGLTYYFDVHSRHLYPFISARTLFTWDKISGAQPDGTNSWKSTNRVWLVSGGGLFMLGQHVGITGEIFYQHERFSTEAFIFNGVSEQVNSSETYGLQWGVAAFIF
jgi:hypothetical protein